MHQLFALSIKRIEPVTTGAENLEPHNGSWASNVVHPLNRDWPVTPAQRERIVIWARRRPIPPAFRCERRP